MFALPGPGTAGKKKTAIMNAIHVTAVTATGKLCGRTKAEFSIPKQSQHASHTNIPSENGPGLNSRPPRNLAEMGTEYAIY